VQALLDAHVPTHGNWMGLSLGWVGGLWLTPLVSQADHRLHHVESWAEQRLQTLRGGTGQFLHPVDVRDDRRAERLEALRDDERWCTFEGVLNQRLLRVYDLQPQRVRLEGTTARGDWGSPQTGCASWGTGRIIAPTCRR